MTNLSLLTGFAQSTTDKTSNQDVAVISTPTVVESPKIKASVPDAKFTKIKIIESYERVLQKGYKTEAMLQTVADYRYFANDLVTAAKWYSELFDYCPDELEPVYYFRYAQSLKSIGENEKAKEMIDLFQSKKN